MLTSQSLSIFRVRLNDSATNHSQVIDHRFQLTVLTQAISGDSNVAIVLCRVSRRVREWVLPTIYHTVILPTSVKIRAFVEGLLVSADNSRRMSIDPTSTFVRRVWIGPTSCRQEGDLFFASKAWPLEDLRLILEQCIRLQDLAMINVYPPLWPRFTVPSTVSTIVLGPIHSRVQLLPDLPSSSDLAKITYTVSLDANDQAKWTLRHIALSSILLGHYRFYPVISRALPHSSGESIVPWSETAYFDLVCRAGSLDAAGRILDGQWESCVSKDRRPPLQDLRKRGSKDDIGILYKGWQMGYGCEVGLNGS